MEKSVIFFYQQQDIAPDFNQRIQYEIVMLMKKRFCHSPETWLFFESQIVFSTKVNLLFLLNLKS